MRLHILLLMLWGLSPFGLAAMGPNGQLVCGGQATFWGNPTAQGSIDIELFQLSDGAQIYLEVAGNPQGIPVIVLHGGPFKCKPSNHFALFDLTKYRVIYFDQRGANRSGDAPFLYRGNYLKTIISDMEEIREHFKIEKWVVFPTSWGGAPAMRYAQTHPQRVSKMILRFPAVYPQDWVDEMIKAFGGREKLLRQAEGQGLSAWWAWLAARNFFLQPDEILRKMENVKNIPAWIVHGDADLTVPISQSRALHANWPGSKLIELPGVAHDVYDERLVSTIFSITTEMANP